MRGKAIRIAAVTDDGLNISQHFGRATYYAVFTAEGATVVKRELRSKVGHVHFASHEAAPEHDDRQAHGFTPEARDRHTQMVAAIQDCQVLLARGMGMGARLCLEQAGITAILTDVADIETAVWAYLREELVDHTELLH